ncbi:MAG: protein tyrosine phosphatase family protein [Candidatus Thiodiazotropha weberae]|nr:protein tyrosine phosphatase family protein [Candidatus Thiodiazotropha lotti]MCG7931347.1 protein tyrosine phosphatase family protein [Candidatus Thiodiazotropha lotti]MCG7988021.1 protein tyrosine phosphatase family protein [Candidatus Thiodiazotropha lotti]MCG8011525.1 protein tyrosine phosphatase family protein [Candidatus Thiodiazotropha lotti]MCG8020207.1 protein tyrosine phosphatase family protein [Candidatus Thiodiazotropha lotti]
MAIENIINYLRISDRIASSGQPDEAQFKAIAQAGFKVVINLAMPNSDHAIPEEGYIVTARKMSYVHIPVPFDAPDAEHLKTFVGIMEGVQDKKVWIHCVVNKRVSAFLYHYQKLVHGLSHEEAVKVMLPSWQPNDVWQEFMGLTLDQTGD